MLTEKRFEEILKLLEEKGTITVQELREQLHASESTIRRDLNSLHDSGRLIKVFGGAVALDSRLRTKDIEVTDRTNVNREEKIKIARYAASLIKQDDFVYLDAGTTTGYMIDFITASQATFVTNGVSHAQRLAAAGLQVILIGGELKASTEAVVGSEAVVNLQKYHFTVGFWGTNGVSRACGFSTPDNNEAMIKKVSMQQSRKAYVLCDHDKLNQVSTVTFADIDSAVILTDRAEGPEYKKWENLIVVEN